MYRTYSILLLFFKIFEFLSCMQLPSDTNKQTPIEKLCLQSVFQSEGVPSLSHAMETGTEVRFGGVNKSAADMKVSMGRGAGGEHYF